jgi:hypothetical protein
VPDDVTEVGSPLKLNMYPRSGNPGYLLGKPVLAGVESDKDYAVDLDPDPLGWLYYPKAGSDGKCPAVDVLTNHFPVAKRASISFGYDSISSCSFEVKLSNFSNSRGCNAMRKKAYDYARHTVDRSKYGAHTCCLSAALPCVF